MLLPDNILQGRYRIVRQLGQGGMGTVYEAMDERLDTTVALKETLFTDEQLCKQFEREARLLARLHHAALPKVIDHFSEQNGQFLVMGFIQGEDLWEMLQKRGAFPVEKVLGWADQLLDALDYLHTQEPPVIHRDIKPQNLKLTTRDQIILLDFGLAKGYAGQISRVTPSGSIFGYTPNYAPLEQIQGTGTDARSDLYALAATLYHLMTGKAPPDVITRVTATTDGQPDPLRPAHQLNGSVEQPIAAVIHRAMALGRTQRFATASEMRETLRWAVDVKNAADRVRAEAETLPPTFVDRAAAERVATPVHNVASSPLHESSATRDAEEARAEEEERLKREAEEAVRRAARERERQEEEGRQRLEAKEAQRKAEIRQKREAQKLEQAAPEPEPSQAPRKPAAIPLAILAGFLLGFFARWFMFFFLRNVGGIILYPLVSSMVVGALLSFYLRGMKLKLGLGLSISYLFVYFFLNGFYFSSTFTLYQLVLFPVGVFIGLKIGSRLASRRDKRNNPT